MKKIINKNRLIFSNLFRQAIINDPLTLIDAGARGDLEEPWSSIDQSILRVIGFEPDLEECKKLNSQSSNRTYIPTALWSNKTNLTVYTTSMPSCSSVYSPNMELIKKFEKKHWETKVVSGTSSFSTSTIDEEIRNKKVHPDFLKIDTQGAEYEILKGSTVSLEQDIFAVLAETWTTEVYKNQPLSDEIMKIMRNNGFSLFEVHTAAAWRRNAGKELTSGKRQIIGLDLLFFKENPSKFYFSTHTKLLKTVAIAEVFGYPDYALEMIQNNQSRFPDYLDLFENVKKQITINSRVKNKFLTRLNRKLFLLFGVKLDEYPSLHS
ncbi:MAG: FkbM family methyltransferase [Candidatus Paceibacterota bacterium]|jgi:FkbM family methyltransferase